MNSEQLTALFALQKAFPDMTAELNDSMLLDSSLVIRLPLSHGQAAFWKQAQQMFAIDTDDSTQSYDDLYNTPDDNPDASSAPWRHVDDGTVCFASNTSNRPGRSGEGLDTVFTCDHGRTVVKRRKATPPTYYMSAEAPKEQPDADIGQTDAHGTRTDDLDDAGR